MKRRNFLKNSLAGSALITSAPTQTLLKTKTNMKVLIFATNWGFGGTHDEFCKRIKADGYDGMELWWPTKPEEQKELFTALKKYQLQVGFLCGGQDKNYEVHAEQFKSAVNAATSNTYQKPVYINCHSGKDFFSFEENSKLIEFTLDKEAKTSIEIMHETHRGRMCFAAHVTKQFLEKHKEMKLTLDISHWTNVHESMLDNQTESVALALNHVGHIHARVGHENGPQVTDPRAPEWKYTLDKHLKWWDTAVENREKSGAKQITFLTEFGPPHYLPTLPFSNQPVVNQWEVNLHMLDLLTKRYK